MVDSRENFVRRSLACCSRAIESMLPSTQCKNAVKRDSLNRPVRITFCTGASSISPSNIADIGDRSQAMHNITDLTEDVSACDNILVFIYYIDGSAPH